MTEAVTLDFAWFITHLQNSDDQRMVLERRALALANAGNAKARRRWRRRNIPNSQRENMGAGK